MNRNESVLNIDTVVIGASAGGVEALSRFVALLPEDLPAALLVVLHLPQVSHSVLPDILSRKGKLPACHAQDGMTVEPGNIYVAPPARHMLLKRKRIILVDGPRENGTRPSADPLFRTAARSCGRSVAGIVLSGMLDDGTQGIAAVRRFGGLTIAQDPSDALFSGMPRNAIEQVGVHHVLPIEGIAQLLRHVCAPTAETGEPDMPEKDQTEMSPAELAELEKQGRPSVFTCPECHGTLFELAEDDYPRFRCRVGHAYSQETLMSDQWNALEAALWTALRSIEENNNLLLRLAERAEAQGFAASGKHYRTKLQDGQKRAEVVRHALEGTARPPMERAS